MNLKNLGAACAVTAAALAIATVPALAATASETITSTGLTVTSPNMTFAGVAITGHAATQTGSYTLDVNDLSGNNAGWKVTLGGGNLTNADTTFLVTTATPPVGAPCTTVVTGCTDLAANVSPTAPFAVVPTATPLYSAAVNTGELDHTFTTAMSVAIPAAVTSGVFSSTWVVSITSGP